MQRRDYQLHMKIGMREIWNFKIMRCLMLALEEEDKRGLFLNLSIICNSQMDELDKPNSKLTR